MSMIPSPVARPCRPPALLRCGVALVLLVAAALPGGSSGSAAPEEEASLLHLSAEVKRQGGQPVTGPAHEAAAPSRAPSAFCASEAPSASLGPPAPPAQGPEAGEAAIFTDAAPLPQAWKAPAAGSSDGARMANVVVFAAVVVVLGGLASAWGQKDEAVIAKMNQLEAVKARPEAQQQQQHRGSQAEKISPPEVHLASDAVDSTLGGSKSESAQQEEKEEDSFYRQHEKKAEQAEEARRQQADVDYFCQQPDKEIRRARKARLQQEDENYYAQLDRYYEQQLAEAVSC